jgi:hypothetical protein
MISPVFVETVRKADKAKTDGGRLIPAITALPPIRTFRRDKFLFWFVFGSGTSVRSADCMGAITSSINLQKKMSFARDAE